MDRRAVGTGLVLVLAISLFTPEARADDGLVTLLLTLPAPAQSVFCLWRASGYGTGSWEAAGWVVRDGEGLAVLPWPANRTAYRESWSGERPPGAVGLIHTHPESTDPRPSETDVLTARDLGLPVTAVSRRGIFTAFPDGRIVRNGDDTWYLRFRARLCDPSAATG